MTSSAIPSASLQPASQPAIQALAQHKRNGHHRSPISDVDAQSSNAASSISATGKVGTKVNVLA